MSKKKLIIAILVVIIALVGTTTIAAGNWMNKTQAMKAFNEKRDVHVLTEEQFSNEIESRDPNEVLFASSIANAFGKNIEEIYTLLEENDSDIRRVQELLRAERGDGRKTPLSLPDKPTEEEAAQITEQLKLGKSLSNPNGNFVNNEKMNLVSLNEAKKTFAEASFLYAFSEEEFELLLQEKKPGEVLLAGNLAHNFEMTVEYVLSIFDDLNADYHSAYDIIYNEWYNHQ